MKLLLFSITDCQSLPNFCNDIAIVITVRSPQRPDIKDTWMPSIYTNVVNLIAWLFIQISSAMAAEPTVGHPAPVESVVEGSTPEKASTTVSEAKAEEKLSEYIP
jgi:hypothetical protein